MIDRQSNQIGIECDTCETVFEAGSLDWDVAWPAAKDMGWKARQIGSEWLHFCPECKASR
ncbi:hypothetical protein [Bradyrhizobium elkanii]|uniref:hypothetical protein n=1 Tax=Bradyrhizobium elkanii TaxID=29448 RepID=UPI0004B45033|nr:hypothetical protein [Bradyrhizobium elkanii]WLA79615.1 hypothetical protein QNJ99_29990 [Bradyrhizobium elkanii]